MPNSGVTAGSYGPSADATPGYGVTFDVPYMTVDAKGRVTEAFTRKIKIPASDNTDTKVTQTVTTTSAEYPLLAKNTTATANITDTSRFAAGVTVNPSTKTITATTFKGNLDGTASKATADASGNNIASTYATKGEMDDKADADHVHGNIQNDGTLGSTASLAVVTDGNKKVTTSSTTAAEIGYVHGVTSSIQTQLNGKAATSHEHAAGDITSGTFATARIPNLAAGKITSGTFDAARIPNLDASKITSGTIDIERLPAGALERLVIVADQAARFALTATDVQIGDTVKQEDTGLMYYVVDISHLDSEAGYEVYTAGAATSVPWSGVTDKPDTFPPSTHSHGNIGSGGTLATANAVVVTDGNKKVLASTTVTTTELGYLDGVTSAIQTQLDGKAPTSHASTATTYGAASATNYGHAMATSTTPIVAGTAAVGSETAKFARGDHVHPAQTSVSGNAGTATKFASNQTVALTGDVTGSASSQAGWSVATTLSNSGVTADTYGSTTQQTPAHGDTFDVPYVTVDAKGRVTAAGTSTVKLPTDQNTDTKVTQTVSTDNAELPLLAKDSNGTTTTTATSKFAAAVKLNPSTGTVTATKFSGPLAGNASSATEFSAAKSVTLTGDVTGTASSKAGWSVATTLSDSGVTAGTIGETSQQTPSHGGTFNIPYVTVDTKGRVTAGGTTTVKLPTDSDTNTKVTQTVTTTSGEYPILAKNTTATATITDTSRFASGVTLNPSTGTITATKFKGATEGNADTATKFASAQTVALTGDVTGSASSQAGWSVATTLSNSGVTADTYGNTSQQTPSHGGTFNVPYVTVDAKGRVTAAGTATVKLPTDQNTDTKVTQTVSTDNSELPLLAKDSNGTSTVTSSSKFAAAVKLNPSTGTVTATKFVGDGSGLTALNGSQVTTGTVAAARIASLDASKIGSGTFNAARIPSLDASKITSGTIDIARLPSGALERLVVVANETARFALTTADVQLGDTVKQEDTGVMYYVKDTDHLDSAAGYEEYTAGAATSVPWSGVTDKPDTFPPTTHGHGNIGSGGTLATANAVVVTDGDKKVLASTSVTTTELGYLDGVTSAIQTQLNGKAPTSHASTATTYGVSSASNYGHAMASSTTPIVAGTAAVGSETAKFARGDHVHPAQTSVSGNAGSATKLATARTIDGVDFNGTAAISHYGSCSTAAGTAEKAVAVTSYKLVTGSWVAVKFTVTNTAANPTLNVNSTGAKAIYYRGAAVSAGYLAANRTYLFVYNGTQYDLIGDLDTNTTYSAGTGLSLSSNQFSLSDSGVTAGTIGNDSQQTPSHGGTFNIPYVTVDAKGRVTAGGTTTVKLPTDQNTDTKVNVTLGTTTKAYLLGTSTTPTSTAQAVTSISDTGVYLDTTAGKLTATTFNGALTGNADTSTKAKGVYLVIPNETTQTATVTATVSEITEYFDGLTIAYRAPFNTAASSTLNINNLGAKPIYYKVNTTSKDYYPANAIVLLVYETTTVSTGCWKMVFSNDGNTNYYDRRNHANAVKAAAAVTAGTIIVGSSAGYKMAASGVTFDVSYPILYASAAISSGSTATNTYEAIGSVNLQTTKASWTGTQYSTVYLVGTISGNTVTIDSSVFTSTVPTTADGKVYIPIGVLYSTYQIYFGPTNSIYHYTNGSFHPYDATTATAGTESLAWNTSTTLATVNGVDIKAKIPSNPNTDTKVNVTLGTTTKAYLLGTSTTPTSTATGVTAISDTGVYLDTTAGKLTATTFAGSLSGNASSATEFSANKTVELTGDVTGSASSKAGWSVATTLANSGVTAGSYGPSANATPAYNATFDVPYITVDAKGRVTAASTKTVKIPASDNTDTKVNVTLGTTTKAYLLGTSTTPTSTAQAVTAISDTGVYLDTTAGKLTATSFAGNGSALTNLNGSNIASGTVAAARIANLDASKITSGTIDIARLPSGALERLVVVADEAARFALTTDDVQLGDTVKQTSPSGTMYYVKDTSKLDQAAGYEEYTAGAATSVPWSGVTSKPSSFTPASHTHGNITNAGAIGSTANLPVITTTSGVLTTGSFGTAANTFCQGNDSRLSDARTPTAHASTATTYGVSSATNYGHAMASSTTPIVAGTAAVGSETAKFARGDHVHPEQTIVKQARGVFFVVPTQTTQSATLTASVDGITEYFPGLTIAYRAPFNTAASSTLNINSLGAKPIYYKVNTASKDYYPANTVILLVYETTTVSTGCWKMVFSYDGNSNTYDRRLHNQAIKAAAAVTAGTVIVGTSAGYKQVASGITFDLQYPILYASAAIAANATATNTYEAIPSISLATTKSGWTGTQYAMAFLVGTLSGTTVTIDSSVFTTTIPNSADDKIYIPIGLTYSTTQVFFAPTKDVYHYTNGSFHLYDATTVTAGTDVLAWNSSVTLATVNGTAIKAKLPQNPDNDTKVAVTLGTTTKAYLLGTSTTPTSTAQAVTSIADTGVYLDTTAGNLTATKFNGDGTGLNIGSTANLPLITTTNGKITTGSFGTAANTFCQGNDSRLSDARTPTSHTHGNITNAGAIGSTANLPVITTTSGVLTTGSFGTAANTFCQGNDSRLSNARTPTAHASTATTYGVSSATNYGHAMASSDTPIVAGTANVGTDNGKFARGDHVHPAQTTITGNAGTATKFASAQSVTLTGDVTGTASSQAGWSVATTLANSGVTAGTYSTVTVDAKGRVTAGNTKHTYTTAANSAKNWYRIANASTSQTDTSAPLHAQFLVTAYNTTQNADYYEQWFVDVEVFGRQAGIRVFGASAVPFSQVRVLYENTLADVSSDDRPAIDLYLNYVVTSACTVKITEIYNSGWTFLADGVLAASTVPTGFENRAQGPYANGVTYCNTADYANYSKINYANISANTTLAVNDTYAKKVLNCTGTITVTVPTGNANTAWFIIKNNGTGVITVKPASTSVYFDNVSANITLQPREFIFLSCQSSGHYSIIADGRWKSSMVYYGTSSEAAGTAAKTVACTDYVLTTGSKVLVKFTNTNTAANATLNVNSTGAKAIYVNGAAIAANRLQGGTIYEFVYNGTQYELVDGKTTTKYTTTDPGTTVPTDLAEGGILIYSS